MLFNTQTLHCTARTKSNSSLFVRSWRLHESGFLDYLAIISKNSLLLWVWVHNSPLIDKSLSAVLAQKPDYQFRFHGTHFCSTRQQTEQKTNHRGHSFSNLTPTIVPALTNRTAKAQLDDHFSVFVTLSPSSFLLLSLGCGSATSY